MSCRGQAIQQTDLGSVTKIPRIPQNRYGISGMHQSVNKWSGRVFSNFPRRSLIVFDDNHSTSAPAHINDLLLSLIDSTPPHVRFMIISRIQPELEIARLHARRPKGFEAFGSIPDETGGEAALNMAQAMTALFESKFSEAQERIDKCHSPAHEYELEAIDFLSLDIGGWFKTAKGEHAAARKLLAEYKRKGKEFKNAFFNTSAAHLLAVNYLHEGRLKDAVQEVDYARGIRAKLEQALLC